MSESSARDPYCLERWPECEPGGHDPRCCRFPKSCSCNDFLDDRGRAEELEARAAELVAYGNSLPDGVTTEAFAEAANLRAEARRLLVPVPRNLAERALTSARAAELTTETRTKVAAAIVAPEDERESLVIEALASAVEALDALTALLLADRVAA